MIRPNKMLGSVLMFLGALTPTSKSYTYTKPIPKLTVVIVVDQFAHHYLPKLSQYFKYGLKTLLNKGVVFENAYHPHAIPETSPGHHALSTATLPKDHGITGNQWFAPSGEKIFSTADDSKNARVLKNGSTYNYGDSSKNTKVDGLSDQFMLASTKDEQHKVFSLSSKTHAAIGTANRLGKPLWFDKKAGHYTSSKRYFKDIPKWVKKFNKKHKLKKLSGVVWSSLYPEDSKAYKFPFLRNYEFAGYQDGWVNRSTIPIDHSKKNPYEKFLKTPHANQLLFWLAQACLKKHLQKQSSDKMLLWLCPSSLDLAGHFFGPDSIECIDMVYQLDKQLQTFIEFVYERYGAGNVLFTLTSDHGIQPIQELSKKKGISHARRIMAKPLIKKLNKLALEKYRINNVIGGFESSYFKLNHKVLAELDDAKKQYLMQDLKNLLLNEPGIKRVWTKTELKQAHYKPDQLEQFYKNHLYRGRFGDLICMPEPYCLITTYPSGCSHNTPYEYDTHVPLIMYQKNRFEKKRVQQKVWLPQLPVTLSRILKIQKPSVTTFNKLPGIVLEEEEK